MMMMMVMMMMMIDDDDDDDDSLIEKLFINVCNRFTIEKCQQLILKSRMKKTFLRKVLEKPRPFEYFSTILQQSDSYLDPPLDLPAQDISSS